MIIKTMYFMLPVLLLFVSIFLYRNNSRAMQKFYLRMTFSYHCRQLYSLVTLMVLILFHYSAHEVMPTEYGIMISTVPMIILFRFKYADKILHLLHDKRKVAYCTALATLVFLFTPHLYTLAATTATILVAAGFYPSHHILHHSVNYENGIKLCEHPNTVVEYYY